MKGNNTLELNHATVVDALQMYFDAKFKVPSPKVVSVTFVSGPRGSAFQVATQEQTEKPSGT